ncbi:hypothetical protein ACZ87_01877, partial [Candidatus Erwinia dacicola]
MLARCKSKISLTIFISKPAFLAFSTRFKLYRLCFIQPFQYPLPLLLPELQVKGLQ